MKMNYEGKYLVDEDVFIELEKRREWNKNRLNVDWEKGHAHYLKMQRDHPHIETVPKCLRQFSPKEYALLMTNGYTTDKNERMEYLEKRVRVLEEELNYYKSR